MKKGDKVVCLNTKTLITLEGELPIGCDLDEGKIYTIDYLYHGEIFEELVLVGIPNVRYSFHRFVTLEKYRRLKLNNIKERIHEER